MTGLPMLTPKSLAMPGVGSLASAFDRNKSRLREITKVAKQAQTPMEQMLAGTAGALTSAGCVAFLGKRRGMMAAGGLGLAAVAYGAVYEEPRSVTFGVANWIPFIHEQGVKLLTRNQDAETAPDAADEDDEEETIRLANK